MTITAPTFTEKTYIIDEGIVTYEPEGEFVVETWPVVGHSLCGDLKYAAKFNNEVVDSDPLAYNEETREFTASSTDESLIPLINPTYSVEVEFVTYPLVTYSTVATASAASTIDFVNPCLKPFKF